MIPAADRIERCLSDVSSLTFANCLKLNADKTKLLWAGSKHASAVLGSSGPSLRLPSDHVRVLGITFSSDLKLDKHISSNMAKFLLAPPGKESSTIPGHRLLEDAGPCLHHVTGGLLQSRACRTTSIHN